MDRNLIEIILDFSFFIILFFISIKDLKEKRYIYLAYLKNKPLKPHIRKFIEYVKKYFIFV